MPEFDTIAAIATAPGKGGVGIIRISGPDSETILSRVFRRAGNAWESHRLYYGRAVDAEGPIDEAMAVLMRAPKSYTREDVAEVQCHGGSYVCARVLAAVLAAGARLAEPGEFTRRAFLNGRIDLSQAEAVMSLIAAQGERARSAALAQLNGGVSAFIREISDALIRAAAGVAACVDYPEEVDEEEACAGLAEELNALREKLLSACDERAARLLGEGLRVALCGRPNVGKSSLLNALLGEERAIVTDIPGTTRDRVDGLLTLGGVTVRLTDTAGLRETDDPVEQLGVQRSNAAMREADAVLLVLDAASPLTAEEEKLLRDTADRGIILLNKADLPPVLTLEGLAGYGMPVLTVSAKTGEGLPALKRLLTERAAVTDSLTFSQPRHIDAARRAAASISRALETLDAGLPIDLTTVDLNAAAQALGEITGEAVDERLLDAVFSQFCVGK